MQPHRYHIGKEAMGAGRIDVGPHRAYFYSADGSEESYSESELVAEITRLVEAHKPRRLYQQALRELLNANATRR